MSRKLHIGDNAPDFHFETPWENTSGFYKITGTSPVILIFLRYMGCPICQVEMAKIKNSIHLAARKKAMVFVVLQSPPATIASISSKDDWPFTIICDPHARIFRQYNVESGSIFKYLHPISVVAAIKAITKGYRHGSFEGIEKQLPASFIISGDKLIKYAYYGQRIDDVPTLETLVEHL